MNKPTITAQVQSDWNELDTTKKSFIVNKPTIPAAQVQSDWNEVDTTKKSFILNKPTIPTSSWSTSGNNFTTGSVGIGSTNPQHMLDIQDSVLNSGKPFIRLSNSAGGAASTCGIIMSPWANRVGGAATQIWAIDDNNASAHLAFGTANTGTTGTLQERVRITSGGNLGIGNTNPQYAIDIIDNVANSGKPFIRLGDSAPGANNACGIIMSPWTNRAGGTATQIWALDDGNASAHLAFGTANTGTSGTLQERMRIKTNGNVGISTTDPQFKLDVNGSSRVTGLITASHYRCTQSELSYTTNYGQNGFFIFTNTWWDGYGYSHLNLCITTKFYDGALAGHWIGRAFLSGSGGIISFHSDSVNLISVSSHWDATGGNYIRVNPANLVQPTTCHYKIYG